MLRLSLSLDDSATDALRRRAAAVPHARKRMVDEALADCLERTIARNPVDTGRSRAAWQAAHEQLTGVPAAVAAGGQSDPIAEGRRAGQLAIHETNDLSERHATNAIEYVPFLEYGTSGRPPFAMLRRALAQTLRNVARFFRLD